MQPGKPIPHMAASYVAANRSVAVILLRLELSGFARPAPRSEGAK